ncbi:Calcium-transporting ATPase CtpE [Austwickia sp. TVS 96-490-7B]|uniref:HAD-IC family P-type ATPase n=1 Tax=Austwickia sp. TVS 96-490-7B TaxID=2830843 RepID=UPI001C57819F|nr:HAD-IC family P-type ATPase [Austwickia sp. TVS 96-490-7B]MBW3084834.1 Calcium-transporting ATPase CtpE [Austwickia sp. TVS 96-490-7B]
MTDHVTEERHRAAPGLTVAEVAQRVAAGQVNDLPPRSGRTVGDIVRANVFTRINAILAVLFGIVVITGSFKNGLFAALIIANSVIGIIQELRAKKTLDSLAVVGQARPIVRRDGQASDLDRNQIVVDDIIELRPGDQVVVDGEIIEADHLDIDESLLTGESDPIGKTVGDPVLSGSFVVAGAGAYRATKVGSEAYAAQLAEEASRYTLVDSELRGGIDQILRYVTYLLIPVGLMTVWVQLNHVHADRDSALLGLVAALVPMVPEGLVLMTSVAFAVGVVRLGRHGCLVQELPAIEGLARVDVVCVDKTGTLTEGGMQLDDVIPVVAGFDRSRMEELLAQFGATDRYPNATMAAIVAHVGVPTDPWPTTASAPFASSTKWSGATFAAAPGRPTSLLLGAPDVLAEPGSPIAMQAEEIGSTGRRVVLLSEADGSVDDPTRLGQPRPLALVVLAQQVRADAAETVAYFDDQGVDVKVISGDNAAAVAAVAQSVGIGETRSVADAVDARTLPQDQDRLADVLQGHAVFGRVTPQQKRAMVGALQSRGHVVAMTGDGVNDVLALKDSDVGVAMGSGSAASRSAAQIVLLDDRFATLPKVVAEGRRVIGNIERVAALFLTKTFYSCVLALLVGLFGMPFPFVPLHVTITAWFTIGIPAFILSLAPNADRAHTGFARRALARSAPAGIIIGVLAFVTYAVLRSQLHDATREQISTAVLLVVIGIAMWVLKVVTRPDRPWKFVLLGMSALAYVVMFTVPPLSRFLMLDIGSVSALGAAAVAVLIGIASCEMVWYLERRSSGRVSSN